MPESNQHSTLRDYIQSETTAVYLDGGRYVVVPDTFLLNLEEQLEAVEERVARALYEKAMEERRSCLAGFRQDKRWDDDPYVEPVREGESRPTDWRDDWREQARYFLSDSYPAKERDA